MTFDKTRLINCVVVDATFPIGEEIHGSVSRDTWGTLFAIRIHSLDTMRRAPFSSALGRNPDIHIFIAVPTGCSVLESSRDEEQFSPIRTDKRIEIRPVFA